MEKIYFQQTSIRMMHDWGGTWVKSNRDEYTGVLGKDEEHHGCDHGVKHKQRD